MQLPSAITGRLALLVVTVLGPIFLVSLAAAVKVYRDTQKTVSDVGT
ncbi:MULTISPECIES: hypothetical protein [unclassified Roseateles]|nr:MULTISPECIES: hypothetical protein [unclassified Roseateles]